MKTERHGYKFTNKNNTRDGLISTVLAVASFVMLAFGIVISFRADGNAGIDAGMLGTTSFVFSTIGEVLGLRSFKERDKFYLYSWIGTITNGILWIAMCSVIVMGMVL